MNYSYSYHFLRLTKEVTVNVLDISALEIRALQTTSGMENHLCIILKNGERVFCANLTIQDFHNKLTGAT